MRSGASSVGSVQITTKVVMLLGILTLVWYAILLFFRGVAGDGIAYLLLVTAESIAMVQWLGLFATVLLGGGYRETEEVQKIKAMVQGVDRQRVPPDLLAIFVPVAGEPLEMIARTVTAARDVRLAHRTIVCDDGGSEDVRALCSSLGVEYLRRPSPDGRKAGNINFGLAKIRTEYFAIIDADHVPSPAFLEETLPWLLSDERMAFVQTPQCYRNREGFIAGGSSEMQEIFYRHVQPGKNAFGAAFCVGTNVLFRRIAIDEIGGIYEASNSEDIWTSMLLHERGWTSVFVPTVLAEGLAPETLGDHFQQQFRWARGGLELLLRHNPVRSSLTHDQKIQYLFTTSHYLSGVAILCYALLPLLYAYFGLRPLSAEGAGLWFSHALPYLLLLMLSVVHLLGRVPLWRSLVVAVSAFPAHLSALLSVMTGLQARWSVTGVIKRRTDYITAVGPHLLLGAFALGGIPKVLLDASAPIPERSMMAFWLCVIVAVATSVVRRALPEREPSPVTSLHASYA